jgi:hypothetical protein
MDQHQHNKFFCESCGIPMNTTQDYEGRNANNKYCKYCAPSETLKTTEGTREGWIHAVMRMEHISREDAEKKQTKQCSQCLLGEVHN